MTKVKLIIWVTLMSLKCTKCVAFHRKYHTIKIWENARGKAIKYATFSLRNFINEKQENWREMRRAVLQRIRGLCLNSPRITSIVPPSSSVGLSTVPLHP